MILDEINKKFIELSCDKYARFIEIFSFSFY
jgi:hypothetical protein